MALVGAKRPEVIEGTLAVLKRLSSSSPACPYLHDWLTSTEWAEVSSCPTAPIRDSLTLSEDVASIAEVFNYQSTYYAEHGKRDPTYDRPYRAASGLGLFQVLHFDLPDAEAWARSNCIYDLMTRLCLIAEIPCEVSRASALKKATTAFMVSAKLRDPVSGKLLEAFHGGEHYGLPWTCRVASAGCGVALSVRSLRRLGDALIVASPGSPTAALLKIIGIDTPGSSLVATQRESRGDMVVCGVEPTDRLSGIYITACYCITAPLVEALMVEHSSDAIAWLSEETAGGAFVSWFKENPHPAPLTAYREWKKFYCLTRAGTTQKKAKRHIVCAWEQGGSAFAT